MSFLTYEFLQQNKEQFLLNRRINEINNVNYSKRVKVFLSHKHDEPIELINQVKGFFLSLNADLYIDWLDNNMPAITNEDTANKLKQKITETDKFIVLATPKSISSIWIPWEIGLADQLKGLDNVAILPIIHESDNWERREYYRIYSKIEQISGEWRVIPPQRDYTGTNLLKWLNN